MLKQLSGLLKVMGGLKCTFQILKEYLIFLTTIALTGNCLEKSLCLKKGLDRIRLHFLCGCNSGFAFLKSFHYLDVWCDLHGLVCR